MHSDSILMPRKIHPNIYFPMNSGILGETFIEWMACFSANTEILLSASLKKICVIAQGQSNWEGGLTCFYLYASSRHFGFLK